MSAAKKAHRIRKLLRFEAQKPPEPPETSPCDLPISRGQIHRPFKQHLRPSPTANQSLLQSQGSTLKENSVRKSYEWPSQASSSNLKQRTRLKHFLNPESLLSQDQLSSVSRAS